MEIGTKDVENREDRGTLVHVQNETGEPQFEGEGEDRKPVTLRVAGTYSKTFRKAKEQSRERTLKRGRAGLTGEALFKQELELTAACILPEDFGPFTVNGRPFEYSQKNAQLLLESAPWIREQVEEAMSDHQSFSTAPSQS